MSQVKTLAASLLAREINIYWRERGMLTDWRLILIITNNQLLEREGERGGGGRYF